MPDKVLILGSGGREHALAWKLSQSDQLEAVFVAPGNAGTLKSGKISNVAVNIKDFKEIVAWCKQKEISMVVVGPEDPLADGVADFLKENDVACFGPMAAAAQIEASKAFSKDFMTRHNIPTARWRPFTDYDTAAHYINTADHDALVVKASGLAAGKGVIVAKDKAEACQAAKDILQENKFGKAGNEVVIEEILYGEEVSCLAFTDGKNIACFPPAQDHKRILDGDQGLNTGGMGAYCPCPLVTDADLKVIKEEVLQRAVDGLRQDGKPYIGVLYAGLMLTKDGPKCLEYNCRFGDPETQVILPLLETDLYTVMKHCVAGDLAALDLKFKEEQRAVAVVAVSGGYPGSYKKGLPITGVDEVEKQKDMIVFHAGTSVKDGSLVTSGGRVLAVVAMDNDLQTATARATQGVADIKFTDKFYRKDIAHKAIKTQQPRGLSYKDAGVDISAGDNLVTNIKPLAAMTARPGCTADLGMFGGLFDTKAAGYKDPLLVSGTDGVGTKLKVAQICGMHQTVGEDLVAMCVNDILCHGAEPLFFLDYFACGRLEVGVAQKVVEGVANGCKLAGCALLGGETAEMPGMYKEGDYDLAGFAVGAVERKGYLPRMDQIKEGDLVISLASSGLHSNGFSLVRKVVERSALNMMDTCPWDPAKKLGESLLTPTMIYARQLLPLLQTNKVKAVAHITGGGLPGNVNRVLPAGLAVTLDALTWTIPPVFNWIQRNGDVAIEEMSRTFNCGVGMVLVINPELEEEVLTHLSLNGTQAVVAGQVHQRTEGMDQVIVKNLDQSLGQAISTSGPKRKKVGVLISGSGTNLQALIDHTLKVSARPSSAEIVLVISNKPGVGGLTRAQKAGIPTKVISHKGRSRGEFEDEIHASLMEAGVEIVCLAGFMRILTGPFVKRWEGRMLNVHPSLLPSFKGANAHRLVLEAGVRVSGCTVHFVAEDVDAGAILVQETIPVYPTDTEETLAERVKTVEHQAFPQALELVASGKVKLGNDGKLQWSI